MFSTTTTRSMIARPSSTSSSSSSSSLLKKQYRASPKQRSKKSINVTVRFIIHHRHHQFTLFLEWVKQIHFRSKQMTSPRDERQLFLLSLSFSLSLYARTSSSIHHRVRALTFVLIHHHTRSHKNNKRVIIINRRMRNLEWTLQTQSRSWSDARRWYIWIK